MKSMDVTANKEFAYTPYGKIEIPDLANCIGQSLKRSVLKV